VLTRAPTKPYSLIRGREKISPGAVEATGFRTGSAYRNETLFGDVPIPQST